MLCLGDGLFHVCMSHTRRALLANKRATGERVHPSSLSRTAEAEEMHRQSRDALAGRTVCWHPFARQCVSLISDADDIEFKAPELRAHLVDAPGKQAAQIDG